MNKTYQLIAHSPDDLYPIAKEILDKSNGIRFFSLFGSMGAGKTTLIKEFAKILGSKDNVSSPTFSLVNEYTDKNGAPFYHFDLYRINKLEEVYDFGFEEYLFGNSYCFFEWPEKIMELLPETYVYIKINVTENEEREIKFGVYKKEEPSIS